MQNAFQLCRNQNQEFGDNKKQNNMSSHDLHATTKQVISSHLLKRTAAKCAKLKNARATRATLLVFIVKYKNLWRSRVPSCTVYLSHLHMGNHWDLKVPSTNCKASRTTVKIPRDFETKGKLCRRQPKLRALSCFQLVTSFSPFSFLNALSPFLSSFPFILK